MKSLKFRTVGLLCAALTATSAMAQQVTLRLHHFLPPQANVPALAIAPWAKKVEAESGGRIKVQIFPAMQMGARPLSCSTRRVTAWPTSPGPCWVTPPAAS